MNSLLKQFCSHAGRLLVVGSVCVTSASPALAAVTNLYTFNDGTALDSVGGQNGTLFGTNGSITGGQLVLDNNGEGGAEIQAPLALISISRTG